MCASSRARSSTRGISARLLRGSLALGSTEGLRQGGKRVLGEGRGSNLSIGKRTLAKWIAAFQAPLIYLSPLWTYFYDSRIPSKEFFFMEKGKVEKLFIGNYFYKIWF